MNARDGGWDRSEGAAARHVWWWLTLAVAAALGLRSAAAGRNFLHPDEVMHFMAAAEPTLRSTLDAARVHAHPPLYLLALHFWMVFGDSEWWLRMLSAVAGAAALAVLCLTVRNLFGGAAAILVAGFGATNGFLIGIGAEVRQYALMHLGVACAFYFQERYFRSAARRDLGLSVAGICLGVATHYSALFAVPALGAAALVQAAQSGEPRRRLTPWITLHLATLGLIGLLYVTHLSQLRGSFTEQLAQGKWLEHVYYQPGDGSRWSYVVSRSWELLIAQLGVGSTALQTATPESRITTVAVLSFLAAVAGGLWLRRRSHPIWPALAALGAGGGLMAIASAQSLYPFGGTRHSSVVALLWLPVAGGALAALLRDRVALALVVLAAWVPVAVGLQDTRAWVEGIPERRIGLLREAMVEFRSTVAPGETVFTDQWSGLTFAYYVRRPGERIQGRYRTGRPLELESGGYPIITTPQRIFSWAGQADLFAAAIAVFRGDHPEVDHVWSVTLGMPGVSERLARRRLPRVDSARVVNPKIEYFRVQLAPSPAPAPRTPQS